MIINVCCVRGSVQRHLYRSCLFTLNSTWTRSKSKCTIYLVFVKLNSAIASKCSHAVFSYFSLVRCFSVCKCSKQHTCFYLYKHNHCRRSFSFSVYTSERIHCSKFDNDSGKWLIICKLTLIALFFPFKFSSIHNFFE